MQPRQFIIVKWCLYSGLTLLFCLVQTCVLGYLQVGGVVPFLYPGLAAMVASYEGSSGGPLFAVGLGALCDLGVPTPFPGFYTLTFTLAAVLIGLVAEVLLTPGLLRSLAASAIAFLVTGLGRLLVMGAGGQGAALGAAAVLALQEFLLTLPLLLPVFLAYRRLYNRVSREY